MRFLRASVFVLICSWLLVIALISGCGDAGDPDGDTTQTSAAPASLEKPIAAPQPEPGQPAPQEQPSPYGEGSTSAQAVGVTIDGMQLNDVRWADHGAFFRIVFDMGTPEGEPVLQVPHAETTLSPDGKTITVLLSGIRSLGSSANAEAKQLDVSDSLVASVERIEAPDDQSLVYEIKLTRAVKYSLAGLGSPGRIVIDINR